MSEIKNGGPAFPAMSPTDAKITRPIQGMSLRDYFAAVALQGIIANGSSAPTIDMALRLRGGTHEADAAYAWADAMLIAREEKHES